MVFFCDEGFIFRRFGVRITPCSYIGAYVVGLIIFGSSFGKGKEYSRTGT